MGLNKNLYQINTHKLIRNYTYLTIGLFIISYGIALSVRSNLGTTPISVIPYVFSFIQPISLGVLTIIFNTIFILLQIIILRDKFPRIQIFQIIITLAFGYFINFSLSITEIFTPHNIYEQWTLCIIACFIIAVGVLFEINSHAIILPADGLLLAVKIVTKHEFGKIKTIFDTTNVVIATIISLISFGTFKGVGYGTIFAAITVGYIVRFYKHITVIILKHLKPKALET